MNLSSVVSWVTWLSISPMAFLSWLHSHGMPAETAPRVRRRNPGLCPHPDRKLLRTRTPEAFEARTAIPGFIPKARRSRKTSAGRRQD